MRHQSTCNARGLPSRLANAHRTRLTALTRCRTDTVDLKDNPPSFVRHVVMHSLRYVNSVTVTWIHPPQRVTSAAQILLFQPLQPLRLIHAQLTVFLVPAIVGLLGAAELPAGVEHGQAFAGVELNRPQMLNNLLGRIPFLKHDSAPWLRSSLTFTMDRICPSRSLYAGIAFLFQVSDLPHYAMAVSPRSEDSMSTQSSHTSLRFWSQAHRSNEGR